MASAGAAALLAARRGTTNRLHFDAIADAKEILDAALKLDTAERARIAHEIIVSLDDEPADDGVEGAWEQELARRAAEIEAQTVQLEPWPKVRQELLDIVRGR